MASIIWKLCHSLFSALVRPWWSYLSAGPTTTVMQIPPQLLTITEEMLKKKITTRLPPELLAIVAINLVKKDLKHLRLVCSTLAENTGPFLFTSLFLSTDPYDLEQAELHLRRLKNLITTIVLSPLRYGRLTLRAYENAVIWTAEGDERVDWSVDGCATWDHVHTDHEMYCRLENRAGQRSSKARFEVMLQPVLREAPTIRRAVITHRKRFNPMQVQELTQYCGLPDCALSPERHAKLRLAPLEGHESLEEREMFPEIAQAMLFLSSAGKTQTQEITMQPTPSSEGPSTAPAASCEFPARNPPQISIPMANLPKIRLEVADSSQSQVFLPKAATARFLAEARHLEYLWLAAHHPHYPKRFMQLRMAPPRSPRAQGSKSGRNRAASLLPERNRAAAPWCSTTAPGTATTRRLSSNVARATTALDGLHMECHLPGLGDVCLVLLPPERPLSSPWLLCKASGMQILGCGAQEGCFQEGSNPFSIPRLDPWLAGCCRGEEPVMIECIESGTTTMARGFHAAW